MVMANTMRISLNNTTQNKKIYWKTKQKIQKGATSDKALLLFYFYFYRFPDDQGIFLMKILLDTTHFSHHNEKN
jgi:hypothetical protein